LCVPRLSPFDVEIVAAGESIASEGKGEYMYVEGRVLSTDGTPIPNATIETWEADENGKTTDFVGWHVKLLARAYPNS
jgi:protocatechuate 3,4-dioxygenase beta subunit